MGDLYCEPKARRLQPGERDSQCWRVSLPNVGAIDSAPSPHWGRDFGRGHDCGERAGVRGVGDTYGPLPPTLFPAVEFLPKAVPIAGERGQELASGQRSGGTPNCQGSRPRRNPRFMPHPKGVRKHQGRTLILAGHCGSHLVGTHSLREPPREPAVIDWENLTSLPAWAVMWGISFALYGLLKVVSWSAGPTAAPV